MTTDSILQLRSVHRLKMLHCIVTFVFILPAMTSAEPAPKTIHPGTYVRDGDSGTLTIRMVGQNKRIFEIESNGQNCHFCGVTGEIRGVTGRAGSWSGNGSDPKCEISFTANRSAVEVDAITKVKCRAYCGVRADFDGSYQAPSATCTSAGRRALRDQFLHLYRSRRFSQAANKLLSLTKQCEQFMSRIELDQVRNDLALAQYHSGDVSQCLQTLGTTLAADVREENELKSGKGSTYLPPCDFDNYIDVAKSIWSSKELCTKAISKER